MRLPPFWQVFIGVWLLFGGLFIAAFQFGVYQYFPAFSFIAYGVLITGLLWALVRAGTRLHFILCSMSLILLGTFATLDMLSAKQEILALWQQHQWIDLNADNVNDYIQVLIILLNVFTGSLAAGSLFHGLVKMK